MTFIPPLLSLFPVKLRFPGHILRVSIDDSAESVPCCMCHWREREAPGKQLGVT